MIRWWRDFPKGHVGQVRDGSWREKVGLLAGSDAADLCSQRLEAAGYINVRRYAGGIPDWEDAKYPLEGESVPRRSGKERDGGLSL